MCEAPIVWEAVIFLVGFSAAMVILIVGGTYGITRVADNAIRKGRQ